MIIGGAVGLDAKAFGLASRVNVGTQEQKLPAVLGLFVLDHLAHPVIGILAAGIFQAVGGDDEQRLFRSVFGSGVLVHHSDVLDGTAHRIQQRGGTAGAVLVLGHRLHPLQRHAVVQHGAMIVEQHGADQYGALLLLLLADHTVKAANGVLLHTAHGTAAIQNKNQFCHVKLLLKVCCVFLTTV